MTTTPETLGVQAATALVNKQQIDLERANALCELAASDEYLAVIAALSDIWAPSESGWGLNSSCGHLISAMNMLAQSASQERTNLDLTLNPMPIPPFTSE